MLFTSFLTINSATLRVTFVLKKNAEKLRIRARLEHLGSAHAHIYHLCCYIFPLRLQMESLSNRIANYFLQRGYKKGDAVALFMENRPGKGTYINHVDS